MKQEDELSTNISSKTLVSVNYNGEDESYLVCGD